MIRIFGIDFTSAPSSRKPITVARAELDGNHLLIERVERLENWEEFEAFLNEPGPWRAGFDFPFSQPLQLFDDYGISGSWEHLVCQLTSAGRAAFESRLRNYKLNQPAGKKHHFRATDRAARACSPMTLDFTPVGKMFFEGAPRLIKANLSILPGRPTGDLRVAVEAYPKLVAIKCVGNASYKADSKPKQAEQQRTTRCEILRSIEEVASQQYGISIHLSQELTQAAVSDPTGDTLDSILCALQAAWSQNCSNPPHGIPANADPREGWIVDPALLDLHKPTKQRA